MNKLQRCMQRVAVPSVSFSPVRFVPSFRFEFLFACFSAFFRSSVVRHNLISYNTQKSHFASQLSQVHHRLPSGGRKQAPRGVNHPPTAAARQIDRYRHRAIGTSTAIRICVSTSPPPPAHSMLHDGHVSRSEILALLPLRSESCTLSSP